MYLVGGGGGPPGLGMTSTGLDIIPSVDLLTSDDLESTSMAVGLEVCVGGGGGGGTEGLLQDTDRTTITIKVVLRLYVTMYLRKIRL